MDTKFGCRICTPGGHGNLEGLLIPRCVWVGLRALNMMIMLKRSISLFIRGGVCQKKKFFLFRNTCYNTDAHSIYKRHPM